MKTFARILTVSLLCSTLAVAQSGTIAAGDNLVVDAIPPIPAQLAEAVGRYTEFRAASLASWHPTKREMLIGTRFGDTSQIHHVKNPGGARTQLTFFADPASGASFEPKTGEYFIFSKAAGGNEVFQN
jgi:hypothetical protein